MDIINSVFEVFINFFTSFAEFFNKLPWGDLVNSLLSKIMTK